MKYRVICQHWYDQPINYLRYFETEAEARECYAFHVEGSKRLGYSHHDYKCQVWTWPAPNSAMIDPYWRDLI